MVNDPPRADPELLIARHIGSRQESFHRVHVGVEAAITVKLCEFRVPCVAGEPFFLVPEALVIERDGLVEQFLRAGTARQYGAGRRQDHKGMGVARLAGQNTVVRSPPAVPSAVHSVMELAAKALKGCVRQLFASGMAKECPDAVHMAHAGRDPGLAGPFFPGRSVISEVVGTASGGREPVAETQYILRVVPQKFPVLGSVDLILCLHALTSFISFHETVDRFVHFVDRCLVILPDSFHNTVFHVLLQDQLSRIVDL